MRMFGTSRPSPAMVVAVVALGFAIVGSAVAGTDGVSSKLTKSKVKSISKKQADKELKANVSGSRVNQADTATNAESLGGAPAAGYAKNACDQSSGAIKGSVTINDATVTAALSGQGVENAYNCSGGAVTARRISTGKYEVLFADNPALGALATPNQRDGSDNWSINSASVNRVGPGRYKVQIFNHGVVNFLNGSFELVLP